MFGIDDAIGVLLAGGVLTWIRDKIQSAIEGNERKARDLETAARRYEAEIAKEKSEHELIKKKNNLQERLSSVELQLKSCKDNTDAMKLECRQSDLTLWETNEAIIKLERAESTLKEQLKNAENSDKYNDVLSRIQLLSSTTKKMIDNRDIITREQRRIRDRLKENDRMIKDLNGEKINIQQQMQQMDNMSNRPACRMTPWDPAEVARERAAFFGPEKNAATSGVWTKEEMEKVHAAHCESDKTFGHEKNAYHAEMTPWTMEEMAMMHAQSMNLLPQYKEFIEAGYALPADPVASLPAYKMTPWTQEEIERYHARSMILSHHFEEFDAFLKKSNKKIVG